MTGSCTTEIQRRPPRSGEGEGGKEKEKRKKKEDLQKTAQVSICIQGENP
jgi:hypothetical protein